MNSEYTLSEEEIDSILNAEKHSKEWLDANARFTGEVAVYEDLAPSDGE